MKILLISWYFPPINDIGAIRIARLAEFLRDQGHDVHVLTGDRGNKDESLFTSFPESQVSRSPWFDVNALVHFWRGGPSNVAQLPKTDRTRQALTKSSGLAEKLKSALSDLYINLTWIPDHQVGWIPYAKRAGMEIIARERFELIYASGPPFSAFVVAQSLSRRSGVPWIAEYRDGWSGDIYTDRPKWRAPIDNLIENRVTGTARALVTVSELSANYYRKRFGKLTAAIYNGYDPEDLTAIEIRKRESDKPVSIVHMGAMYGGVRDPSVLYEAIRRSGLMPHDIRVSYYGAAGASIYPLAMKFGVSDFVTVCDRVAHKESLEIERSSDVLLLLQSPLDPRNVPAKLFEYLAAQRPILGLGLDSGIPAQLIRERKAGFYVSDPDALAAQLQRWVNEKRNNGIANLPAEAHAGLSRTEQFVKLEEFLRSVC